MFELVIVQLCIINIACQLTRDIGNPNYYSSSVHLHAHNIGRDTVVVLCALCALLLLYSVLISWGG
jgi:hypothetical protein